MSDKFATKIVIFVYNSKLFANFLYYNLIGLLSISSINYLSYRLLSALKILHKQRATTLLIDGRNHHGSHCNKQQQYT